LLGRIIHQQEFGFPSGLILKIGQVADVISVS
jgi:hypothetical protein